MALELYEDDDTTLVDDLAFAALAAGVDSDVLTMHLWQDKGLGSPQPAANVQLVLETEDPETAGSYLRSGVDPQDELWGRIRIVGYDNTSDPSWSVASTDWTPLGAYSTLPIGTIPGDCAVYIELKMRPPSTAAATSWRWQLVPLADEYASAVPPALTYHERGVLTGVGDFGHGGLIRGGAVTANSPADAKVDVAAALWVADGIVYGKVAGEVTLNQTAADGALAAAQYYWAALTLGAGSVTTTKGNKGAAPALPTPPAGEPLVAFVKVDYQVGGTSVIEAADIDTAAVFFDRYVVASGDGLEVTVSPGRALGGGTYRFHYGESTVSGLDASDTSYLWQLATGLWDATLTEEAPASTALGPFAEITTDADSVTAIVDRRTMAGRTVCLRGHGATPGSPGVFDELVVEHERLFVEETVFRVSDNGGGASGSTKAEWFKNGTTAFTSKASDDQRPEIAYNATTLIDRDGFHEVCELRKGDVVRFDTTAHPVGGSPARVEMVLVCRVP